jgi:hypothetical protein
MPVTKDIMLFDPSNFQKLFLYFTRLSLFVCMLIIAFGCFNSEKIASEDAVQSTGFSIKGISMVAPVNRIGESGLQPIVKVNANSIAIMPYAFCSPENPEIRYNHKGQWWGESDDGVIGSIELAHQKNISVMLKPHLWIGRGMYTGAFVLQTEKEWQIWEESYRKYILHFATIADSLQIELFCIGTELGASIKTRPDFWASLIDTVKQVYHGKLTYAGNWDDYKNFPFWEKLDYIGVDAYFPLAKDKTPDVASLKTAWKKHSNELEALSKKHNRPVLFTEYGYRNVDYTTAEPWKEMDEARNDAAQANALEGLYQSFAYRKWFAGGYLWKWYVDSGRHNRREIDFTPQNKSGEKVVETWYLK